MTSRCQMHHSLGSSLYVWVEGCFGSLKTKQSFSCSHFIIVLGFESQGRSSAALKLVASQSCVLKAERSHELVLADVVQSNAAAAERSMELVSININK